MPETFRPKRRNLLEMKTIKGTEATYLFIRTEDGSYHAFVEVEGTQAALDCGAKREKGKNQRALCKQIWDKS